MSKKIFLFISVSILSAAFLFSLNSVAIKAQNFSENQDNQYVPPVVSHKESESGLNFYLYPSEEYVQQMHEEGLSDEDIAKIWDSANQTTKQNSSCFLWKHLRKCPKKNLLNVQHTLPRDRSPDRIPCIHIKRTGTPDSGGPGASQHDVDGLLLGALRRS